MLLLRAVNVFIGDVLTYMHACEAWTEEADSSMTSKWNRIFSSEEPERDLSLCGCGSSANNKSEMLSR